METFIIRKPGDCAVVIHRVVDLNLAKPWSVTIKPYRKGRTLSQNALMWKWVNEVANYVQDYTGMDADEVHEFFKAKFLTPRIAELNGEIMEYRSTKNLSIDEMSQYMNRIYAWATAELGLLLTNPAEVGESSDSDAPRADHD